MRTIKYRPHTDHKDTFNSIAGLQKAKDYVVFLRECQTLSNFAFEEIVNCIVVSLHIFFLL